MGEEEQRARLYIASRISCGRDIKLRGEAFDEGEFDIAWMPCLCLKFDGQGPESLFLLKFKILIK